MPFDESNLYESGANAGTPANGDRLYSQSISGYGGGLSYGYTLKSGGACKWKGSLTVFKRGYGCRYRIFSGKTPFGWTNLKPYSEPPY